MWLCHCLAPSSTYSCILFIIVQQRNIGRHHDYHGKARHVCPGDHAMDPGAQTSTTCEQGENSSRGCCCGDRGGDFSSYALCYWWSHWHCRSGASRRGGTSGDWKYPDRRDPFDTCPSYSQFLRTCIATILNDEKGW